TRVSITEFPAGLQDAPASPPRLPAPLRRSDKSRENRPPVALCRQGAVNIFAGDLLPAKQSPIVQDETPALSIMDREKQASIAKLDDMACRHVDQDGVQRHVRLSIDHPGMSGGDMAQNCRRGAREDLGKLGNGPD